MRTVRIKEPGILRELVRSVIDMPAIGRVTYRSALVLESGAEVAGPWLALIAKPDGTLELSVGEADEEMPPDPLPRRKRSTQ